MLYCGHCQKMVEFNSAAVSSPTAAVTLDLEGDLDPTSIASKTQVFNVCKECGEHSHLYRSKEEFIAVSARKEEEAELNSKLITNGILYAIIGFVIVLINLIFSNQNADQDPGFFDSIIFDGFSGFIGLCIFAGIIGGGGGFLTGCMVSFFCGGGNNVIANTLVCVLVICFLSFTWYQSHAESSAEKKLFTTLNVIDAENSKYADDPRYELQEFAVEYSRRYINKLVSASKNGDTKAEVALGYYKEAQESYDEAFWLYEKAASKGSSRAMFRLGVMNVEGLGLNREQPDVAAEWFSKSGVNEAESIVYRLESFK